jgi:hypothetical protein
MVLPHFPNTNPSLFRVFRALCGKKIGTTERTDWVTDALHRHTQSLLHSVNSVHSVVIGTFLTMEADQQPALARHPFRPPAGTDLLFQMIRKLPGRGADAQAFHGKNMGVKGISR